MIKINMHPTCFLNRIARVKKIFFSGNSDIVQKAYWSSKSSSSSNSSSNSSSSSSGDSDNEAKNKTKSTEKKSEEALNKLNLLLKSMIEEEAVGTNKPKLNLAKPLKKQKVEKEAISPEKQIVDAVKSVAETIGGDTKQTESELLMKLLSTTESNAASNLSDIVKGMKVVRDDTSKESQSRAQQVKQILENIQETKPLDTTQDMQRQRPRFKRVRSEMPTEKIDLFGSEPLGIFTDLPKDATEGVQNKTWNKLYERDLKLAVTHPPRNYFQQMILWTEQGKVWKFPIDNEQDLEKEKKVYFTEHVFLEKHLEPWCPQKGPLRHFMELVCVGLSKNPYLTVEAKKEHIEWYKNYFEEKKQLLKEVGALQARELDKGTPKQIE